MTKDGQIGKTGNTDLMNYGNTEYHNKEPIHPLYVQDYKVHLYQSDENSKAVSVVKTVTINSMGMPFLHRN